MDNYLQTTKAAARRFCTYDFAEIARKPGVFESESHFSLIFLGETARISKKTGEVTFPETGRAGNFRESLTIYDYLCDGKPGARAAGEFCPVGSLPGIFVGGSGLGLNGNALAEKIHRAPEAFRKACAAIGGREVALGDMGFEIPVFQGLTMMLKFYHADEEFPATMTLLWDRNILHFIRYETVYYLGGCVLGRLEGLMREFS